MPLDRLIANQAEENVFLNNMYLFQCFSPIMNLMKKWFPALAIIVVVAVAYTLYYSDSSRKYVAKRDLLSWDGVQPHRSTLVDWKEVNEMRRMSKSVDWSKVGKRKRPRKEDMHDKWIVVTSIAAPTSDVKLLSEIPGWKLLVVGDKKTPRSWRYGQPWYTPAIFAAFLSAIFSL
jgi:hypothetical protein